LKEGRWGEKIDLSESLRMGDVALRKGRENSEERGPIMKLTGGKN